MAVSTATTATPAVIQQQVLLEGREVVSAAPSSSLCDVAQHGTGITSVVHSCMMLWNFQMAMVSTRHSSLFQGSWLVSFLRIEHMGWWLSSVYYVILKRGNRSTINSFKIFKILFLFILIFVFVWKTVLNCEVGLRHQWHVNFLRAKNNTARSDLFPSYKNWCEHMAWPQSTQVSFEIYKLVIKIFCPPLDSCNLFLAW